MPERLESRAPAPILAPPGRKPLRQSNGNTGFLIPGRYRWGLGLEVCFCDARGSLL